MYSLEHCFDPVYPRVWNCLPAKPWMQGGPAESPPPLFSASHYSQFGASKQLKISFPPVVSSTILTALGYWLTLAFPQQNRKEPFLPAEECEISDFLLSGPAFPVPAAETRAASSLRSHSIVSCSFRRARRRILFAILPAALCH